jgi:photosystem II stability/assembly factor-like uncharacterized protein
MVGEIVAQKYADLIRNFDSITPFSRIQQTVNAYFNAMPIKDKEYKQWKRYEWLAQRRLGKGGIQEDIAMRNAVAIQQKNLFPVLSSNPDAATTIYDQWTPIGPTGSNNSNTNVGRVVCMAFHPSNVNIFYVGAASGGLWKTTDGGSTFTALTDSLPAMGISGIVVHPTSPNTVYIITGDGNGSHRGHYIRHYGTGVYKSTDGGLTWSNTGLLWDLSSLTFGFKLVMHPTNYSVLLAATSTGIWRSLNGGSTWTRTINAEISDIEFKPGSASHVFASGYGNTFYYSTDTGRTWNNRIITPNVVDRMEIGVSPANANLIYFLCGPSVGTAGNYAGLYTINTASSYGTAPIITRSTSPNILGYANNGVDGGSQTWRNISMYVSPSNAGSIFTGGCFIWKSVDSGVTMTKSSGGIHADNHFILKHPQNNNLFSGCDGGLFKSTDGGTTWNSISAGLQITQFYRFDGSATSPFRVLGGAQDNSQLLRNGSDTYNVMSCCDGMDNAVDYTNHNIMYMCVQDGALSKSINGTDDNAPVVQPTVGDDYWVTNVKIHSTTNTTVFFGGVGGIRRSTTTGLTWKNIGGSGKDGLAQGVSNDDRMYAADGLTIARSDNVNDTSASVTWTDVSGTAPNYPSDPAIFITDIAVNPANSFEVWISCCGFIDGQKVYRSTDAGQTWTNMSDGLPNLPIHCIEFEDNSGSPGGAVYVGTEIGVYYRDNSINRWVIYGKNLPNALVSDIKIFYGSTRYIIASTFGRGIWYATAYNSCIPDLLLSSDYQGLNIWQASNTIIASGSMLNNGSTAVHLQAGNYVKFNPGASFNAQNGSMHAWIGTCGSGAIPNIRSTAIVIGTENVGAFFNQEPVATNVSYLKPTLVKNASSNHVLGFHSDGIVETRILLKDEKMETLGYFVRSVLPKGNYTIIIPAVKNKSTIQLLFQQGFDKRYFPLKD